MFLEREQCTPQAGGGVVEDEVCSLEAPAWALALPLLGPSLRNKRANVWA